MASSQPEGPLPASNAPPAHRTPGRPGLQWRGAIPQLFFFIVLPLTVLLVALPIGSLTLHARAMRDLVGERDGRAVRAAADAVSEQLNHRAAAIRAVAIHAATSAPNHGLADFEYLQADFEAGLAVFDENGTLLATSSAASSAIWQSQEVADLLAQARTAGQPQFSPAFLDPAAGKYVMLVAAAIPQGPAAAGAFWPASLSQHALETMASPNEEVNAWVVDSRRQLLFQLGSPRPDEELVQHPGVTNALLGQSGTTYLPASDGEHVVAYTPVQPVGWALILEEPWEAVDNPLLRTTQVVPLLLIPAILVAVVAFWFGIKQIVEPLQALEQKAAELGAERYDAIEQPVRGGIGEIRSLQQTLVQMARQIRAYEASIHSYLGMLTRGQEDERRRLARELHDDTVQALIALDQQAQLAQLALRKGAPEVGDRLAGVRRMTTALIADIRRVVRALRPIYLEDLGLLPAMEMLIRDMETTASVRGVFVTEGTVIRLKPELEIAIYRIAQEALSNIARHAAAKAVQVRVQFEPGSPPERGAFCLRIVDDGRGFRMAERISDLAARGHYGLMGMQERADLIGARLSVKSAPGRGTTVELRLAL